MFTIRQFAYSRLTFTRTGQLHAVSGVVHVNKLLLALLDNPDVIDCSTLTHEPLIMVESIQLNSLFQAFRAAREKTAIVFDDYGGTEGTVTLEYFFEEFVGETIDESDLVTEDL